PQPPLAPGVPPRHDPTADEPCSWPPGPAGPCSWPPGPAGPCAWPPGPAGPGATSGRTLAPQEVLRARRPRPPQAGLAVTHTRAGPRRGRLVHDRLVGRGVGGVGPGLGRRPRRALLRGLLRAPGLGRAADATAGRALPARQVELVLRRPAVG